MVLEIDALRVIQAINLLVGAVIVYFALKRFAKHRNRSMLPLAIGFAFVTIGAVLAGVGSNSRAMISSLPTLLRPVVVRWASG